MISIWLHVICRSSLFQLIVSKNNCVIINHTINRQSCYGFDVKRVNILAVCLVPVFLGGRFFYATLSPNFGGYDYWRLFKLQWIVRLYRSQRWKSLEVCKKVQVLHLTWFISKIDMIRNKIYRSRFSRDLLKYLTRILPDHLHIVKTGAI